MPSASRLIAARIAPAFDTALELMLLRLVTRWSGLKVPKETLWPWLLDTEVRLAVKDVGVPVTERRCELTEGSTGMS